MVVTAPTPHITTGTTPQRIAIIEIATGLLHVTTLPLIAIIEEESIDQSPGAIHQYIEDVTEEATLEVSHQGALGGTRIVCL